MPNCVFTPENADDFEVKNCPVCGDLMEVIKDQNGPTSWAAAMAGIKRKYDIVRCPNLTKDWHEQASKLLDEASYTSSPTLAGIFRKDAEKVLLLRATTV